MEIGKSLDLIICTYNNAALLGKALEAISKQKNAENINWQVLVVNNNCTDATVETIAEWSKKYPVPLRMIKEQKQGLHHARVCGIKNTEGDWIGFIDDDCLVAENFVEELIKFTDEHPKCGLFGAKIILDWEVNPPIYALNRKWVFAGKNHGDAPHRRDWIAGTGMILKRSAIEESGWLEKQFLEDRTGESLVSGGDMEMGMRIAKVSEAWYNPACEIRHLIPARRLTRSYVRKIAFGLGASRHNVEALKWKGSYPIWFLYSLFYSLGLLLYAVIEAVREFITSPKEADIPTAFAPVFGWWSAMKTMLTIDSKKRKELIGSAAQRK